MNNITKLPTAAASYYTVRKGRLRGNPVWWVLLVTPGGWQTTSRLAAYATRDAAICAGRAFAGDAKRPFKARAAA